MSGDKRPSIEEEVESIYKELNAKHINSGIWARMIQCGTHDDYIDPPRVLYINEILSKRHSKAISGTAVAVANIRICSFI